VAGGRGAAGGWDGVKRGLIFPIRTMLLIQSIRGGDNLPSDISSQSLQQTPTIEVFDLL
jgi:hypothetical protein